MTISVQSIIESCFEYHSTKDVYYGLDEERISGVLADIITRQTKESLDVSWREMDNASEE